MRTYLFVWWELNPTTCERKRHHKTELQATNIIEACKTFMSTRHPDLIEYIKDDKNTRYSISYNWDTRDFRFLPIYQPKTEQK